MPETRIWELGSRQCCGSHLSSCLLSSLCFSCHCPLHGHRNPDIFDLHSGHFDSPALCGTVEDNLGTNTQPTRTSTVMAQRKLQNMPCCLDRRKERQPANLLNRKMESARGTNIQCAVCMADSTTLWNSCWSVSTLWLLYCLLNHDPHPFFRWALTKPLSFTE